MSYDSLTPAGVKGVLYNAIDTADGIPWVKDLSVEENSTRAKETYGITGQVPPMRKLVGGNLIRELRDANVEIINDEYESTLSVHRKYFERDQTGQINRRILELGKKSDEHWADFMSTAIIDGETSTCYDGQAYFDTDHSWGDSGTQSNDINVDISALPVNQAGSTTMPSPEEMELSILQGVQQIQGLKDDSGKPINNYLTDITVMVPVSFMASASAALFNPVLTSGRTNTITNSKQLTFKLAVNPFLTWTTKFAVFRSDSTAMPFIRQIERDVEINEWLEDSDLFKNHGLYRWRVYARRGLGYGFWEHACLVTLV